LARVPAVHHIPPDPVFNARVPKLQEEAQYAEKEYSPIEAEDVATAVVYAVCQPRRVSTSEIIVRPTEQLR
jgi:NADP-dependent 3-hydroxy acid dehydrogenase YdfG